MWNFFQHLTTPGMAPADTSTTVFAEVGHERNGNFFPQGAS